MGLFESDNVMTPLHKGWMALIMSCVQSVRFSFNLNRCLIGSVVPQQGLSLIPCFSLFFAQKLSRLINDERSFSSPLNNWDLGIQEFVSPTSSLWTLVWFSSIQIWMRAELWIFVLRPMLVRLAKWSTMISPMSFFEKKTLRSWRRHCSRDRSEVYQWTRLLLGAPHGGGSEQERGLFL